mgnify:CR=1 FL=1
MYHTLKIVLAAIRLVAAGCWTLFVNTIEAGMIIIAAVLCAWEFRL